MTEPPDTVPASDAPLPIPVPRPRARGRLLRWWLLASLAATIVLLACVALGLGHADITPLHIVVDGEDLTPGPTLDAPGVAGHLVAGAILFMVTLLLVLVVPLLAFLVLGAVAVAVVLGVGVPLAALVLALALVSSPLWLVGLCVWAVLRHRGPPPAVTMQA